MKTVGRAAAVFALAALCACAGGRGGSRAALELRPFPPFPAETAAGPIAVEARYYLDHRRAFNVDLVREARVLPLAVKLGLAPGAPAAVRFDPRDAAPRLYLHDGTVLAARAPQDVPTTSNKVRDQIALHALDARVLPEFGAAEDGYLYFELGGLGELFVRDATIARKDGDSVHVMSLEDALLGFDVEYGGRVRTVYVGVRAARGAGGR